MTPVALFLHSTGTGPGMWAHVPGDIAPGSARIMPANLGYAPNPPIARGTDVALEQDIANIVAQVPDEPIDIYAHSYGATLALGLLGRVPVRSMFLIEPVLFGALARMPLEPAVVAETRFLQDPWFLDDRERGGTEEWLTLFIDYWNRPGAFASLPAPFREAQLALGWKMFQEVRSCFYATDTFPVVPPDVRLTLAVGGRTTASSKAMTREMSAVNPHATVIVLPGTGHMAPVTHPGRVHAAMREAGE